MWDNKAGREKGKQGKRLTEKEKEAGTHKIKKGGGAGGKAETR